VVAMRNEPGTCETILIQCKRYVSTVGVAPIRELRGVLAQRQANRGVVISTGGFTRAARSFAAQNAMIELLGFGELNLLLNRCFGAKWPNSISYHLRQAQAADAKRGKASSP
jgi:restriction system protein